MKHALFILLVIVAAFVSIALPPGKPVSISGSQVWTNDMSLLATPSVYPVGSEWDNTGIRWIDSEIGANAYTAASAAFSKTPSIGFGWLDLVDSANQVWASVDGSVTGANNTQNAYLQIIGNGWISKSAVSFNAVSSTNSPAYASVILSESGSAHSLTLQVGGSADPVIGFDSAFIVNTNGDVIGHTYTISGTTNQIIFGSTNTAPQTPGTIVKWISVEVQGEANAYRLPLYK